MFQGATELSLDAKGRLVLPGFNDAHVHFIATGAQLSQINLRDAKTPEEFVSRIKEFAAKLPKGPTRPSRINVKFACAATR